MFAKLFKKIDEVIEKGCEIISQMTHLTTVVLGPDANQEKINKVQLVPLNDITAVAVFVTDRGHVEHKTFSIPRDVSIGELESCVNIINDRICGTPINKVADKVSDSRRFAKASEAPIYTRETAPKTLKLSDRAIYKIL